MKRTPFTEYHRAAGAKLVDFAGFEMPVRYTGDVREHQSVRTGVGLFDITHMGEFLVRGEGAQAFLDQVVTNDVSALAVGQALYSPMCRPDGGIVDDLLVYRYADHYMVVVNASNMAKDFAWMEQQKPAGVTFENHSEGTALLAVQGPKAADVLRGHVPDAALELGYYRFLPGPVFGVEATISRTGYTGEDGFELYFPVEHGAKVWEGLIEAGKPHGLELIGLGARDTLRLEMGYMLYGNDIDDTTTPLEAGLSWTVKMSKPSFTGREALAKHKAEGLKRRLVGFQLDGRRVPRHGMPILSGGRVVGVVTSGTFSPTLERPIGMGYVESGLHTTGTELEIQAGTTMLPARVTARPFHTRGSHRS
ncbi:MAG: glycine cleavage system aminomethyltransferase GcvT [Candidatus Eisenbacteria bacterium]|uniref:Aminomethyltransferase n=1 Tax=Eiseniibacteriota bacterium TaxID=2212470 RepID=A0A933SC46_UNCEI|nr:glycine cleavage system aminomethyltransferase GcvT [Candidatus Eisenbacteria bacterium]